MTSLRTRHKLLAALAAAFVLAMVVGIVSFHEGPLLPDLGIGGTAPAADVSCGVVDGDVPSHLPVQGATFVKTIRIDKQVSYDQATWCIAALRIYDRSAEIVGFVTGETTGSVPWATNDLGFRVENLRVQVDKTNFIGAWNLRPGGILSATLIEPGRQVGTWSDTLSSAKTLELQGSTLKDVSGPWSFPVVNVADGPIAASAAKGDLTITLKNLRTNSRNLGAAYLDSGEAMPSPYLQNLDWAPAKDDQGREYKYRGTAILTDDKDVPLPYLFARFDPLASDAKTVQFTINRVFATTTSNWRLTLPLRAAQ